MENINPTWKVIKSIIYSLSAGHSVKRSIHEASDALDSSFEKFLFQWVHSPTQTLSENGTRALTHYQRVLLKILNDGLSGAPILEVLTHLELEVRAACLRELEMHVAKLPFLGMIPLMLLIGPAFLLLLIGPIMSQLLLELSK